MWMRAEEDAKGVYFPSRTMLGHLIDVWTAIVGL